MGAFNVQNHPFDIIFGSKPILISMPHNGILVPDDILLKMTDSAKLLVDTDWYLDKLYQFAVDQGCYLIKPKYNRYVIDLNRSKHDENLYPGQDTTELCPTTQFSKRKIYLDGYEPKQKEIEQRVEQYWQPYHEQIALTLAQIKDKFGIALLFEAHSIKSEVPRFFEGQLPDFNFGTYNGKSCSELLEQSFSGWEPEGYSAVTNGRFKGGYITRAYGNPRKNIHSLQLELSQATYMNEDKLEFDQGKANRVTLALQEMFEKFEQFINNEKQH